MPARVRAGAVLVEAAPLLGVPLWMWVLTQPGIGDYFWVVMFMPGLFMLAAGLAVAAIAFYGARPGFVRVRAVSSLRFHGILAAIVVVSAAIIVVSPGFDNHAATMAKPPGVFFAAMDAGAVDVGVMLTIVETLRALAFGIVALHGPGRQTSLPPQGEHP